MNYISKIFVVNTLFLVNLNARNYNLNDTQNKAKDICN